MTITADLNDVAFATATDADGTSHVTITAGDTVLEVTGPFDRIRDALETMWRGLPMSDGATAICATSVWERIIADIREQLLTGPDKYLAAAVAEYTEITGMSIEEGINTITEIHIRANRDEENWYPENRITVIEGARPDHSTPFDDCFADDLYADCLSFPDVRSNLMDLKGGFDSSWELRLTKTPSGDIAAS